LLAAAQQYAYARVSERGAVVVVFNNDTKPATVEFGVAPARLPNEATLDDRLDTIKNVRVQGGKLKLTLPARSASILTNIPAR
jgi:hypothetical protein